MIGLMDCNNFFVSCERLFRPDLMNKPVAVLSSNDGCIVARSQEVKDIGIPMAIPYFKVKDTCTEKEITLFSSNFSLYRDISSRVMSALKDECGVCEVYSVDEAFFTLDSNVTVNDLQEMRERVMKKTGIPVSIGVSTTKTLAKLASSTAKRGIGVFMLQESDRETFLNDIPCGAVWGIGRQTSAHLVKENIVHINDFISLERDYVRKTLGVVGERLYLELSGNPVYGVSEISDHIQESYTSSRSFGATTHEKSTLMSALSHHVAQLAKKLRISDSVASTISIVIRGSRHGEYSHRTGTLRTVIPIPTNDTFILTKEVSILLDRLYDSEIPYKKAGVTLGGIQPVAVTQNSLFAQDEIKSKTSILSTVMDAINKGKHVSQISFAVSLDDKKWKEKKALRSQEYTTRWSEIASVKAI